MSSPKYDLIMKLESELETLRSEMTKLRSMFVMLYESYSGAANESDKSFRMDLIHRNEASQRELSGMIVKIQEDLRQARARLASVHETGKADGGTPGSRATPSSNTLHNLVDDILRCEFEIVVNGASINRTNRTAHQEVVSSLKLAASQTIIERKPTTEFLNEISCLGDVDGETSIDFSLLTQKTEATFQAADIQSFVNDKKNRAMDSSSTSPAGPFFTPCTWSDVKSGRIQNLYSKRGRPDCSSLAAPMELEIKDTSKNEGAGPVAHTWAVLNQGVERVAVRMHLAGYLRYSFAFATCGRFAWYIEAERQVSSRGCKPIVRLSIFRIKLTDIHPIWRAITEHAQAIPDFFLTNDGPIICAALLKSGITPWACRVNWIGSSMSNVYAVSVGRKRGKYIDVAPERRLADFALKIIFGEEVSFERESFALEEIAKHASAGNSDDEKKSSTIDEIDNSGGTAKNSGADGDGTMSVDEKIDISDAQDAIDELTRQKASESPRGFYALRIDGAKKEKTLEGCGVKWDKLHGGDQALASIENSWWSGLPANFDGLEGDDFGAIFMKIGDNLKTSSPIDRRDFVADVLESLSLAHKAGILHCDIRKSNVMKFGDKWQLIDYGLSGTIHDTKYDDLVQGGGSQWDGAGRRVRQKTTNREQYQWTTEDDMNMMTLMAISAVEHYDSASVQGGPFATPTKRSVVH